MSGVKGEWVWWNGEFVQISGMGGGDVAGDVYGHWPMDEGIGGATIVDQENGRDGVIYNAEWVEDDDYTGGYALESSGSEEQQITITEEDLGDLGEWVVEPHAFALTVETDEPGFIFKIPGPEDGDAVGVRCSTRGGFSTDEGRFSVIIAAGDDNNSASIQTTFDVNDGVRRRYLFNKPTNDPQSWQLYIAEEGDDGYTLDSDNWEVAGDDTHITDPFTPEHEMNLMSGDDDSGHREPISGPIDDFVRWADHVDSDTAGYDAARQEWL